MAQEAFNKFFIIKFLTTCPFCPGILPGLASMTEPLRGDAISRNSLIGEFDLVTSQPAHHSPITFVDCDFCKSIVSCGDDLIYIYNKMKKSLVKNKYIAFTFSLRVVGFDATLDWLKANFPELSVENRNINRYVPEMKRRQYIKELNPALYIYRDSGDNMISGLTKL